MDTRHVSTRTIGGIALLVLTAVVGVLAAPELPSQVTTTWDAGGDPSETMGKTVFLVGGPALVAGLVALFAVIPRIDPLAENIAAFRRAYDAGAVLVAGFAAYAYLAVVLWNMGYSFAMTQALAPAVGALFVGLGLVLDRAERNWFVGIRTPWTLSSETVWRNTHDVAGTLFKLAGFVALAGVVLPEYFVYLVAGPAVLIAVVTTVYSYVDYRRLEGSGDSLADDT